MQPFLGCIGVAPAGGEARSSIVPAEFGGNMDAPEARPGYTLYLPVNVPGALLYMGDGHAAQGDGEVAGTAIEVPLRVRLQVDLIKGKKIAWPRFENDTSLMRRRRLPSAGRCAAHRVHGAGRLDPRRLQAVGARRLRAPLEGRQDPSRRDGRSQLRRRRERREALPPEAMSLSFDEAQRLASRLRDELGRAIIGQHAVIQEILIAFFAGGHCLLRGVPGLAKTLLIKTLAQAVHLKFNRIQFTPDLMPSDIIGTEVIEEDRGTGRREIRFIPGPVFANVILADEINRTPPKTQAALLEAMQEYQVTVNGVRYALERPLFVLATQNPIEQEGTYPLPEAQLDRFMFNVVIDYPSARRGASHPGVDDRRTTSR